MTQKDLILKWHQEELVPTEIHEKLVDIFVEKAISLSTVSRTIRQLSLKPSKLADKISPGRPPNLCNEHLMSSKKTQKFHADIFVVQTKFHIQLEITH